MKVLKPLALLIFRSLPCRIREIVLALRAHFIRFILYGGHELPTSIEIETDWRCNRHCWYCSRPSDGITMTEELFQRIIMDLHTWGFKGRISLHSFNEPLLDKRLCRFIKLVKVNLPQCPIVIYSNGDLLTEKMMLRLIAAGMNKIKVSIHEPTSETRILELTKLARKYPSIILMEYRDNHRNFSLVTRGNDEIIKKMGKIRIFFLCYVIYNCVVRSDGNVVLCCNDGLKENIMGNVTINTVQEIWESSKYKEIRNQVFRGKFTLPICKKCGYQTRALL
jgi:GTP 3',8-cyclase